MSKQHLKFGRKGLIAFYERLMEEGRITENGPAHTRLKELQAKLDNRTGWIDCIKKKDTDKSLAWLKKVMN